MKSKFNVKGMHCTSCAMIIENEIDEMGIIDDVCCNYTKSTLEMDSDTEFTENELNKKFEKFNYTFEKA